MRFLPQATIDRRAATGAQLAAQEQAVPPVLLVGSSGHSNRAAQGIQTKL